MAWSRGDSFCDGWGSYYIIRKSQGSNCRWCKRTIPAGNLHAAKEFESIYLCLRCATKAANE